MVSITSVGVFCGSNTGRGGGYVDAARELGRLLARSGITLVYGGAGVGTMGVVADAVLGAGGSAIGVIPSHQVAEEIAHTGLTELHVVDSMHERKAMMAELSDGFVALPGGFGTLEEFAEALTWSQLGLHAKPTGLLNTGGFYSHLLGFLDHAVAEGFIRPTDRGLVLDSRDPGALLHALRVWAPRVDQQWRPVQSPPGSDAHRGVP